MQAAVAAPNAVEAASVVPVPIEAVPAKLVPASVQAPADVPVQAVQSPVKSVPASSESPAVVEQKKESQSVLAAANVPAQNSSVTDTTKAEPPKQSPKKKFSFSPLKKVGPIRLVDGFRSSQLRPRISLDSQKDVADNVREWLYERRNKYEKFVDNVLGKASPISAKQPAPGADSAANDAAAAVAAVSAVGAGVATPSPPPEAQRDPSGK